MRVGMTSAGVLWRWRHEPSSKRQTPGDRGTQSLRGSQSWLGCQKEHANEHLSIDSETRDACIDGSLAPRRRLRAAGRGRERDVRSADVLRGVDDGERVELDQWAELDQRAELFERVELDQRTELAEWVEFDQWVELAERVDHPGRTEDLLVHRQMRLTGDPHHHAEGRQREPHAITRSAGHGARVGV